MGRPKSLDPGFGERATLRNPVQVAVSAHQKATGAVRPCHAVMLTHVVNPFSVGRVQNVSSRALDLWTRLIGITASSGARTRFRKIQGRSIARARGGPAKATSGRVGARMVGSIT